MGHAELSAAVDRAWQLLPLNWRAKITFATSLEWPIDLETQRRVWLAGPCWIWQGWNSGNGYGKLKIGGKCCMAHRAIFEFVCGPIEPPTDKLDYLCRMRACVNPYHCEPVTVRVNTERGNGKLYQFPKRAA